MKILFVCSLGLALAGCASDPAAPSSQFVIRVDSVAAPSDVVTGDVFTAKFYGTVGGSSCYSLRRVEQTLSFTESEFTFVGEKCESGGGVAVMVYLDHSALIRARGVGPMTIVVHEPDGATLIRQVTVH